MAKGIIGQAIKITLSALPINVPTAVGKSLVKTDK